MGETGQVSDIPEKDDPPGERFPPADRISKPERGGSDSVDRGSSPDEDHSRRATREIESDPRLDALPEDATVLDERRSDPQSPTESLLGRRQMSRQKIERETDREEPANGPRYLEIPPQDRRASESLVDRVRTEDPRILRDDPDLRSDRDDSRFLESLRHGIPPPRSRPGPTSRSDARAGIAR